MEALMNKEDQVIKYYNRFLDLAEPLLDARWLDDNDTDKLFWYGFHPEDRAMLLYWLCSKYPHQQSEVYFTLRQVFRAARNIFSLRPRDLQWELWDALDRYPIPRGPYDYRRDVECGPSLSQHHAQELVQKLEAQARRCRKRDKEDREIEDLLDHIHGLSVYKEEYTIQYKLCMHHFPDLINDLPSPRYYDDLDIPSLPCILSTCNRQPSHLPSSTHVSVAQFPSPVPLSPLLSPSPCTIPMPAQPEYVADIILPLSTDLLHMPSLHLDAATPTLPHSSPTPSVPPAEPQSTLLMIDTLPTPGPPSSVLPSPPMSPLHELAPSQPLSLTVTSSRLSGINVTGHRTQEQEDSLKIGQSDTTLSTKTP